MSPSPPHPALALRPLPLLQPPLLSASAAAPCPCCASRGGTRGPRGPAPAPRCVPPPPCTALRWLRSRYMWHRRPAVQPCAAHKPSRPCGARPAGLGVRRRTGRHGDRSAPRRGFPGGESAAGTSLAARSLCTARAGAAAGSRFSEVTGVCAGASCMGSMGAPLRGDSGHGGGARAARVRLRRLRLCSRSISSLWYVAILLLAPLSRSCRCAE